MNATEELIALYRKRRAENLGKAEAAKKALTEKVPKVLELENSINSVWTKNVKALMSGNSEALNKIKDEISRLNAEKLELIIKNGFNPDDFEIKYNCGICKDSGFVDGKKCACFKKELSLLKYKKSNLGKLLETESFDNFNFSYYSDKISPAEGISPLENIKSIFSTCIAFVKNFDKSDENLLLYGSPGLGKTFLSTSIAKDLLDLGYDVLYQNAYQIFTLFEDYRFNRIDSAFGKNQIDSFKNVDLLIIDDLGTEATSIYTGASLFDIVSTRLINGKKTIINTNLSLKDISELYSERVASRLVGNYTRLKFFGTDIRFIQNS